MDKQERSKYSKRYYQKNKEKLKERNRGKYKKDKDYFKNYYQKNKEKLKTYRKIYLGDYYQKNKEKLKERNRERYEKDKDYLKNYYKENKEKFKEYRKEWNNKNPNYYNSPERIKKRNEYNKRTEVKERKKENWLRHKDKRKERRVLKEYGLSIGDYERLTKRCALCGFDRYEVDCHHIDRNKKNNNKGNLIGLCPNCHHGIHRGKMRVTEEELKSLLQKDNSKHYF